MAALTYEQHRDAFRKFHKENPTIFKLLVRFAREAVSAGVKKLSISLLVERVRWETQVVTRGSSYKISNNHKPFYARKMMRVYPDEFGGMLDIKEQTSRSNR